MVSKIRTSQPVQVINTETKAGECRIELTINLDINLNGGKVSIASSESEAKEDKTDWAIPEFISEKINFGKKV